MVEYTILVVGVIAGILLGVAITGSHFIDKFEQCEKQGYFAFNNQKYECKVTNEWVEK